MFSSILFVYFYHCFGYVFFFKQKTAYEMRISDWSSDVCSSDLNPDPRVVNAYIDGEVKRTIQTYSGEVNLDLAFGTLTSITALRKVKFNFVPTFLSNPIDTPAKIESTRFVKENKSQYSQAPLLAFAAWDGRLKGHTGLYFP